MTLMDRVGAAQAESGSFVLGANSWMLDELKDEVGAIIAGDALASLAVDNPKRARSELKSAIRAVFATAKWSARSGEAKESLAKELMDTVFGLGPLQPLVEDPQVTEIMVNGTESVFVERSGVVEFQGALFANAVQLRSLIDRILAPLGRRVDESSPMVDARLPNGHRVNVVIPPIALDGPAVTIRKFTERAMRLEDMQERGSFDERVAQLLRWAVESRRNVAVCGGTGSGKTTMLNALSCVISEKERIVTIEDSAELKFSEHPHVVRLESRASNAEGVGEVSIRDLVRNALRMRPDRIIVGECRGAEALDMLTAMNTGHDGSLTTLHANSPADMVMRLVTMVRYGMDLPVEVIEGNIASALDVVVQVSRGCDGRRFVSAVASVERGDDAACVIRESFSRKTADDEGCWQSVPRWLDEACALGSVDDCEVEAWKARCF
ncbi:MAG: CpaF family protein [Slackia sp.]|nr:CpaF family protein [Slackia sp.]